MSIANRVSHYNRERKWRTFLECFAPDEETTILDVGFTNTESSPHANYLERRYPYPERLTALGVEGSDAFSKSYPAVRAVNYDGGIFPFGDAEFDISWSNATLEHVGGRSNQLLFLKELIRVSRRGFVTTPNRYFPIEVHSRLPLVHYLPKSYYDRILVAVGKGYIGGDNLHLLSRRQFHNLLVEAGAKNINLIQNRLGGFTLDFVAIFDCQS
jgi:hypothetical protein